MLSWEKKNPKCQHFQMENNLRWALYKVSGALQHKVYLGKGEGSECFGAVVRCLIGWEEKEKNKPLLENEHKETEIILKSSVG